MQSQDRPARKVSRSAPGVSYRHSRTCADHYACGKRCNGSDTPWEAWVYDKRYLDPVTGRRGKKIRRRFTDFQAAKGWRADALGEVKRHELHAVDRATARKTLAAEVAEWLEGARSGSITRKGGESYKPSTIRGYELALRLRVLPVLGDRRLTDITRRDLLELKEQLQGEGIAGSTVRNSFVPLQAIYRRARRHGLVVNNPADDLELPTAAVRERAATPTHATDLLQPLDVEEAGAWATAFYAGLRRGELRALRIRNVDLEAGTISVERSWDAKEGEVLPKSKAGTRTVFVAAALRPYLEPLVDGRTGDEFVFGGSSPFEPRAVERKAQRRWDAEDKRRESREEPSLVRFTLHEARHSFSTWLDHSGVSADRADRYMGHSSGSVASRYRHLLAAQITDDRNRFDAYVSGTASGTVVALTA